MPTPLLVTTPTVHTPKLPALIIDKEGSIGASLLSRLRPHYRILYISSQDDASSEEIYLPYLTSLPRLPKAEFAQILVVFHTRADAEKNLRQVLKTARKSGASLLVIAGLSVLTQSYREKILQYPKATIILLGDLFGTRDLLSPAAHLIRSAKKDKQIRLSNMGMMPLLPISRNGVTDFILEVLFGQQTKRLFLATGNERTALSFVRFLQKVEPLLKVDFMAKKEKPRVITFPPEAQFLTPALPSEEEEIKRILAEPHREVERKPRIVKKEATRMGKVLVGAAFLLLLPFITLIWTYLIGFCGLGVAGIAFSHQQLRLTHIASDISRTAFSFSEPSEQLVANVFDITGFTLPQNDYITLLVSGKTSAVLLSSLSESMLEVENGLMGNGMVTPDRLRVAMKQATYALQSLEAQNALPSSFKEELAQERQSISFFTGMLDIAPTLLGYDGKKHYLVLLQNNMELRPGGGYIHAVGSVVFERGELRDISVQPVSDFDSRLKGHLDPPFAIKRYNEAAHWYLRDSNLFLDSTDNATSAARFLQLETGDSGDGILSVDLSFVRQLLGITGPVDVAGKKVSKESMFQDIATSGTKGEEDQFLIALEKTVLQKMGSEKLSAQNLLSIMTKGIREKHFQFMATDPSIQPLLERGGLLSTPRAISTSDLIGISETNVGNNNANYFLKRSIAQKVQLRNDRTASSSVTLIYTNTSRDDKFGGDYISYVQVLLPPAATIRGILINGVAQSLFPAETDATVYGKFTFQKPKGIELEKKTVYGKSLFGFLLTVKKGEERTVVITYSPGPVLNSEHLSYDLTYFKQPGIEQDDYSLEVEYPKPLVPSSFPDGVEKKKTSLSLSREIAEDQVFHFTFRTP